MKLNTAKIAQLAGMRSVEVEQIASEAGVIPSSTPLNLCDSVKLLNHLPERNVQDFFKNLHSSASPETYLEIRRAWVLSGTPAEPQAVKPPAECDDLLYRRAMDNAKKLSREKQIRMYREIQELLLGDSHANQ